MTKLNARIAALEKELGTSTGPRRVLCIVGSDTSDEAVSEFLSSYGIDREHEDMLLIIVRSLEAPEGTSVRKYPNFPMGFVGPAPDWVKALPAYQQRHG